MSDNKILKILLVGSDELLWDSMKMYFETKGFAVSMASTAEEALAYLHRYSSDLIISEHGQSSVDAFALFGEIGKRRLASSSFKVIICDSFDCKTECNGRKRHADFCISKPLTGDMVNQMLDRVLDPIDKSMES